MNQLLEKASSHTSHLDSKLEQHSKYMEKEYIEFFKSRRRIKEEWSQFSSSVQAKLDQQLEQICEYEEHLAKVNLNDNIIA